MADVTLEVATQRGRVLLTVTLDGEACPFWMDLDEARDLVNSLGEAIKFVADREARAR